MLHHPVLGFQLVSSLPARYHIPHSVLYGRFLKFRETPLQLHITPIFLTLTKSSNSRNVWKDLKSFNNLLILNFEVVKLTDWRGGRVVECTGLENRHTFTGIGSSNLPPSATSPHCPRVTSAVIVWDMGNWGNTFLTYWSCASWLFLL